jgi:phage protein D
MAASSRSATSYEITIGSGKPLTQPKNDGLESLVVEDHVDMVEMCTMRFQGSEGSPPFAAEIGDKVTVKMGEGSRTLFKGEITALEPSWSVDGLITLTVRALDNAHRLARGRKTRFFNQKKDSDVAQTVGSESELSVSADPTTETHDYILQRNESNLAFLKRLAARNNFQVTVDGGTLYFKKASFSGSSQTITMGSNLRSLRMNFNSQDQATKVIVRGWDIRTKQEIVGTATSSDVTAIGGGDIGASLSNSKFGEQIAYITDVPIGSQAMANDVAKAEMERLARQFARGTCIVDGNDSLYAGAIVKFSGLQMPHNGKYYIIATRHVITPQTGYTTEITFCGNTLGT